jgi:hypothetical protein
MVVASRDKRGCTMWHNSVYVGCLFLRLRGQAPYVANLLYNQRARHVL